MKTISTLLICSLFFSCNFKKTLEKIDTINSDLRTTFNHQDITTGISMGTNEGSNNVIVSFYNFNLDSLSISDLTNLASRVELRVCEKNSSFKKLDYIEVRFTKQEYPDNASDLVSFKFEDNALCNPNRR
ncbi:MAG: hypothetical protein U0V75_04945 [Ferruginibacter sp.]